MVTHRQLISPTPFGPWPQKSHNCELSTRPHGVSVRRAIAGDAAGIARVAALDSARVPAGPVLLAEVDEIVVAAVSLADGHVVADPFQRTTDIVELLRLRAAQLDGRGPLPAAARRRRRFRLPALSR
jgi:hypothetical protein